MFPDGLDPIIMRAVRPLFARGDYDTAVFRAFKEVEVRVRKKDASLAACRTEVFSGVATSGI
jgi:hypothetical protein